MARKRTKTTMSLASGAYLLALRIKIGLTLREVEKLARGEVSNGYLSQIESGYISFPHPRCLYALSRVYGTDYQQVLRVCYTPVRDMDEEHSISNNASLAVSGLSREEFIACQAFITTYRKIGKVS